QGGLIAAAMTTIVLRSRDPDVASHLSGIGAVASVRPEIEHLRPDQPEMKEGGRRTRPDVEGKGQRPVRPAIPRDIGG
ncbi:hypothetical protein AB9F39_39435, partial [Rhizobium leguminosarum]|uniref:hypothetical protein n=1 Tax=Rhizobium leguminosarum TaxID=384 RepID=UPI003F9584E2